MKDWTYAEKEHGFEALPDVEPVPGLEPFVVREFPLPARRRASLANGVIGLRLPAVPFVGAEAVVNGLVGRSASDGMEAYAPAPNPVAADIVVGSDRLSERPDLVRLGEQVLDIGFGELVSRFQFVAALATLDVEVLTFASRSLPTVVCQELTVQADRDCAFQLESALNPVGLPGSVLERRLPGTRADAAMWWETRGGLSTIGAAFKAQLTGVEKFESRRNDWGNEADLCLRVFSLNLRAGRRVVLRQIGSLVPSALHSEPHWQALRMVAFGWYQGFDRLRHENRLAWRELWRARPVLSGAPPNTQRILDSAFHYLHAAVHSSSPCGVAPFGLSRVDQYFGHVFIDWEQIMFPVVLLTNPDAARATLDYRTRLLPAARANAACMGYRGLMFPWESALSGAEVTRPHAVDCVMEFSTPAIASAFLQFAQATGDRRFLRDQAWPVVAGAADWIVSRVTRTARGYEVRNLCASETQPNTNNDPAVCRGFIALLREAIALASTLGEEPQPRWAAVADKILVLTDPDALRREAAWEPDKSFEGEGDLFSKASRKVGIPISDILGVDYALAQGDREVAARVWQACAEAHWQPDFGGFREWGLNFKHGVFDMDVFLTWPGNILRQTLFAFTGLEISDAAPERWPRRPVNLPAGWESIEVERLWIRGEPMRLSARHGSMATLDACR